MPKKTGPKPEMKMPAKVKKNAIPRKMNALDAAITSGKTLPSKNKQIPGDSDVGMKGFKKKPIIKIKKK